jgi:transcriptional regulator with XRE-family HTH domain
VAESTPVGKGNEREPSIGERLRTLRQARRWSLGDLHRETGVSIAYLSRIEQDEALPRADKLTAIRNAFGPDAEGLFDELEAAELVERHGLDQEIAEAALTLRRLDPDARIRLLDIMREMLTETRGLRGPRESPDSQHLELGNPGEAAQR